MDARPIHFLLVEDDDDHAELVSMALAENQVINTMDRVSDGEQALDFVHQRGAYAGSLRPDVILLDLKLPKLSGHEVLGHLKSDPALRTIPVVILTTSEVEADKQKAYCENANSYLVKPVNFDKFHQMVKDLRLYWAVWNQAPVLARAK